LKKWKLAPLKKRDFRTLSFSPGGTPLKEARGALPFTPKTNLEKFKIEKKIQEKKLSKLRLQLYI
jgi:hypothetical protein